MNVRGLTAAAVCIVGAGLWLFSQAGRHSAHQVLTVGAPAEAQAPPDALVHVREVPDMDATSEHDWHRYQLTVPPQHPPLDMHVIFFLDRKGYDITYQRPDAWPQTTHLAYRLDADEDSRVKAILQAQGLPVKEQVVTYHIASVTDFGSISLDQTLKFGRGTMGTAEEDGLSNEPAPVGKETALDDELLSQDTSRAMPGDWQQAGYLTSHPAQHRFTVSVVFRPHHGPAVKYPHSYAHSVTRT